MRDLTFAGIRVNYQGVPTDTTSNNVDPVPVIFEDNGLEFEMHVQVHCGAVVLVNPVLSVVWSSSTGLPLTPQTRITDVETFMQVPIHKRFGNKTNQAVYIKKYMQEYGDRTFVVQQQNAHIIAHANCMRDFIERHSQPIRWPGKCGGARMSFTGGLVTLTLHAPVEAFRPGINSIQDVVDAWYYLLRESSPTSSVAADVGNRLRQLADTIDPASNGGLRKRPTPRRGRRFCRSGRPPFGALPRR